MRKIKFLMLATVSILLSACVTDPTTESAGREETQSVAKIINTPENSVGGEIVLYVDDATAKLWRESDSITRSGDAATIAIVDELGVVEVEPVFSMKMNAEKKMKRGMHRWFIVRFSEDVELSTAAEKFAQMPAVSKVQFNKQIARPKVTVHPAEEMPVTRAEDMPFNDPSLRLQWHYNNTGNTELSAFAKAGEDIGAFGAWKYTAGNRDVVVAVVDEGIKYTHPDLAANMWVNEIEKGGLPGVDDDDNGWVDDIYGVNTVDQNGDISWDVYATVKDKNGNDVYAGDTGHGTHVAGTVAAVNNNGRGGAGVAGGTGKGDGVRIMSIQIFDGPGSAGDVETARGIVYAADMGASILQNSWGYTDARLTDSQYKAQQEFTYEALAYFMDQSNCPAMDGGVVIFAAGNDNESYSEYPGAYHEYISVASYTTDGLPTGYTNYGPGCNVAAPGGEYEFNLRGSPIYTPEVYSTLPAETPNPVYQGNKKYNTDYGYMQGTSMACPHVSGVAALLLSYALENGIHITADRLKEILTTSVRDIDSSLKGKTAQRYDYWGNKFNLGLTPYYGGMGTGKLDATLAIMNLRGATCVPVMVDMDAEIDVNKILGTGDLHITLYCEEDNRKAGITIDDDVMDRLGVANYMIYDNKLILTCTKPGVGVVKVKYIAGGSKYDPTNTPTGLLLEKELVIVSRESNDDMGWL